MLYLKQSTASQIVLLGPFVDDTDGTTAEDSLTIANTDILLSKSGGGMTAKNSGGGTVDTNGWYTITLNATDTNTVGRLQISCKVAGALAVFMEMHVLEENIYDSLMAASAAAFDSNQRVDVASVAGTAQTANDIGADANTLVARDDAAILIGNAGIGLTHLSNHLTDIKGTSFVKDTHSLIDIEGYVDLIDDVTSGLAKIASDLRLTVSAVAGISGSTMVGTDNALLAVNVPTNFSSLGIESGGAISTLDGHTAQTGDNYTRIGIGGAGLTDLTTNLTLILADTNELQTDWANGGRLDVIADATLAMLDDARGEPSQGAPAVNPDMATKVDYLYKFMRNKIVTGTTAIQIYDGAGSTIDHLSTISAAGNTFTRGEFITGA